jgi:phenylpropionate dioxygenase-like ring-hydroxylating dioxygenase large terminal subunit
VRCQYHAWSWSHSGDLLSAPYSDAQPGGFDKTKYRLQPVPLKTLGPFIFVDVWGLAPPWEDFVGQLPQQMMDTGHDLMSLPYRERRVYEMACNWKVSCGDLAIGDCMTCAEGISTTITITKWPHQVRRRWEQRHPQGANLGSNGN